MTTDRETLRLLGDWLEDGRTALPDHILDTVLEQLPTKPQRRPSRLARRYPNVNALVKYGLAAAAVVVVAIVGFNLMGRASNEVGAPPSATASPPASAAPAPTAGAFTPGRYFWESPGGSVAFTVPDGFPSGDIAIDDVWMPGGPNPINQVFIDACKTDTPTDPNGRLVDVGPTVEELVSAVDAQESTDAVVTDFTAGSVVGKRVEVQQSASLADRSECSEGPDGPLKIWPGYFAISPDHRGIAYAFEKDGTRFVFTTQIAATTPTADISRIDDLVRSME